MTHFLAIVAADGAVLEGQTGAFLVLDSSYTGKRISVRVTHTALAGSVQSAETEAVQAVSAQTEHLIINQVYGNGGKSSPAWSTTALSSFITQPGSGCQSGRIQYSLYIRRNRRDAGAYRGDTGTYFLSDSLR